MLYVIFQQDLYTVKGILCYAMDVKDIFISNIDGNKEVVKHSCYIFVFYEDNYTF